MKKMQCLSIAVLFSAVVVAAPKGEFWEKKDYKQWSQKEVTKMLEKSPWAQQFTNQGVGIGGRDLDAMDAAQPYIKYQVQFRSAQPIRQAIVRQMALNQKYDSLSSEQKQQFDKSAEAFLSADVSSVVVVYITYETNNIEYDRQLARHWQSQTVDLLKNYVYLSSNKGDKVQLANYSVGQGGGRSFQFIFPREVNGNPIVDPVKDKSLKLEFNYPIIGNLGNGNAFMEFKLEKMIFAGNVAY
jgi:hypothetical protein